MTQAEVNKAHAGAAITPFPPTAVFDTTDRRVIVSVLRFDPQLDKFRDDDFIVLNAGIHKAADDDWTRASRKSLLIPA